MNNPEAKTTETCALGEAEDSMPGAGEQKEPLKDFLFFQNHTLTEQGKALKNVRLLECVNVPMERRVVAQVRSWQVARMLRRDFNLYSVHVFFRMQRACPEEKKAVREVIAEILAQATVLSFAVREIPGAVIDESFEIETIPVRLISRDTSFLYRAIMSLDEPFARLGSAYRRGLIPPEETNEMLSPCLEAYRYLRTMLWSPDWKLATEADIRALG